jgi:uncharacterized protein (DUF58 family)
MKSAQPTSDKALLRWRHAQIVRERRRRVGWLRSLGRSNRVLPRKLEVTREGKWMIAIALLLGVGAINTGNNLLYLVLSLLISVITVSGILSEWALRGVTLSREYPQELEAGSSALLRVEVHNGKRSGTFSIEVSEAIDPTELALRSGYVLHLKGDETGQCFQVARPLKRGPLESGGIRMSTRYPFGFARKSRIFDLPVQWLVLPPIADVELTGIGAGGTGDEHRSRRAGHGGEFRGLREARHGDSLRDIHWKVSARRNRLIAREWEAEATRVVVLRFAHVAPDELHDARLEPHLDPKVLDASCATVAGIASRLLQAGMSVGLVTFQGAIAAAADPDGNGGQMQRLRRHLAHLTCGDRKPPANWPIEDDVWLDACRSADKRKLAIEAGEAVSWASAERGVTGETWWIRWAARDDVKLAGVPPVVDIKLSGRGEIERIDRPEQNTRGAA